MTTGYDHDTQPVNRSKKVSAAYVFTCAHCAMKHEFNPLDVEQEAYSTKEIYRHRSQTVEWKEEMEAASKLKKNSQRYFFLFCVFSFHFLSRVLVELSGSFFLCRFLFFHHRCCCYCWLWMTEWVTQVPCFSFILKIIILFLVTTDEQRQLLPLLKQIQIMKIGCDK